MERLRINRPLDDSTFKKYIKIGGVKYAVHLYEKVVYVTDCCEYTSIYMMCDAGLFLIMVGLNEFL